MIKLNEAAGNQLAIGNLQRVLISLFYLLIIFICYPGLFLHFSNAVIRGDVGDLHNILSIISHTINVPLNLVYHLPIFYPESYVLTKTHPLFGISIFFYFFKLIGLNLSESTNLYIILSLVFGSWGVFLLAGEFVQKKFFPLLFSILYILHPLNHLHFVWLNFLGRFYFPFIFLFFIKYFKTRKKRFCIAAVIFSFFQFLTSIYYGVLLWAIMIPIFLLIALILKIVTFSRLRFPLLCLVVGFLLLLFIFYPYVAHNSSAIKHFDGRLTQVEELFSISKVFAMGLSDPENISQYLFLGILFTAFGLLFFVTYISRKRFLIYGILFFSLLLMCYLVYVNRILLNLVFLLFLIFIVYLTVLSWKEMDQWVKLLLLIFGFMFLFLFQFTYPPFLKLLAPYRLFYALLPVGGLTVIKRTFLILLPFFIVLVSIGASRLFQGIYQLKPYKKYLIFIGLLFLLMLENIHNPKLYTNGNYGIMKPLPQISKIYEKLPFKCNKVVLEIPFYIRRRLKNTYYMLNWQYHQNPLMNGKITIFPGCYYHKLSAAIGKFQQKFPTAEGVKKLLQDYSVSYIIIHWDLLKQYQQYRRIPIQNEEIVRRIKNLTQFIEIIYKDSNHMVLKLRENLPMNEIIRTYSLYHLKYCTIKLNLKEKYRGTVHILLNGIPVKTLQVQDTIIKLNLQNAALLESGNRIQVQFDHTITLNDISLI